MRTVVPVAPRRSAPLRAYAAALGFFVVASAARAELAPPAKPQPPPPTSPATRPARPNPVLCGCASSRFLARGSVTLDADTTVSAWLHGGARLETFTRPPAVEGAPGPPALAPTPLPVAMNAHRARDDDDDDDGDALVLLSAAGDGAGFLGVVRPRESAPREVLAVSLRAGQRDGVADDARPPVLDALWLAGPEARERAPCGTWTTLRAAFQVRAGSPAVEAFAVRDVQTGERRLVDARHVGAFGLGAVPTCGHGFPVADTPQTLELIPIAATGTPGDPWLLRHDGRGAIEVVRVATPASADADLVAEPFPVPGAPSRKWSWISVGGMWTASALLAVACGVVGYLFWRFKRRRMQTVRCTSCGAGIPVDVLDRAVDGFFCPACGTAGVWKGRRGVDVDVTRL